MDLYTEKMKNNSLNKITVNLKSHRDYLYSGWEINHIANSLNNVYYKNELINTIKSLLSNGTNPEDIYILNSSVKIGLKYDFIKDGRMSLSSSRDIVNLYYMGSPIPLIPNANTLKVYYIFEIFRSLYKKCNSLGLNPPTRRYTLHNLFEYRNDITSSKSLKEYLENAIYECNPLEENKELDEKVVKLFRSLDTALKLFDNLFKDLELLNEFNKEYSSDIITGLSIEKYISLNKYFNFFKRTFDKLERPFICVYKREEQQLYILCTDLISIKNFTEDNYRFFETKNISQNSPLVISICVGLGFAPSLFKIGESLLSARRTILETKKDLLKLKEETDDMELEITKHDEELSFLKKEINDVEDAIAEIETSTTKNQVITNAKEIISNNNLANRDMDNNFVNEVIGSVEERNNKNLEQMLEEKELNIDNITARENEAS